MADFANHEDLGQILADVIDQLEAQRPFAGDMDATFTVPLEDGTEYQVTVSRK